MTELDKKRIEKKKLEAWDSMATAVYRAERFLNNHKPRGKYKELQCQNAFDACREAMIEIVKIRADISKAQ